MKLLPSSKRVSRLKTFSAALALCVAGGYSAHATTFSWDPGQTGTTAGGGGGNWDLASTFWYNNTTGMDQAWPDGSTSANIDTAVFANTAGTVLTTAAIGVNTIVFNTTGYAVNNGTGGTLTLVGTNPTINVNNTGSDQIGATLLGGLGFTKTGAGTLALASTGTITLGAGASINNTAGTTTVATNIVLPTTGTTGTINASAGSLTFGTTLTTGVISGGQSGQTVVNVTNGAVFALNGANTYSGITNIGTSFVTLGNTSANAATGLGATGTGNGTVIANGGTLRFQNPTNTTIAEPFQISGAGNGGGGNGAIQFYSATGNTLSGAITLSGDSAIVLRANTANRSNTISGGIGEATAGATSAILFSRFNGAATSADSYVLSTTASTYGGNTYITDAAAATGGNATGTTTATNYFFVQSNLSNALPTTTVLTLGGQQTIQGQTVGTAAGAGRFVLNGVDQKVAGLTTAGTAGALNIVAGGSATTLSTLTVSNSTTYTFSGVLGATTTGGNNLALVKTGSSTLTLSGTNTYAGGTTIDAGSLIIASNSGLGTGNVTLTGVAQLTLNAGVVITNMTGTTLTLSTNSVVNLLATAGTVQDTVSSLVINGVTQANGTYGAQGSGATNVLSDFTGGGVLQVNFVPVPEPSTWAAVVGGAGLLGLVWRRRRARLA